MKVNVLSTCTPAHSVSVFLGPFSLSLFLFFLHFRVKWFLETPGKIRIYRTCWWRPCQRKTSCTKLKLKTHTHTLERTMHGLMAEQASSHLDFCLPGAGFLVELAASVLTAAPEEEAGAARGVIINLRKSSLLRLRFSPTSPSGGAIGLEYASCRTGCE